MYNNRACAWCVLSIYTGMRCQLSYYTVQLYKYDAYTVLFSSQIGVDDQYSRSRIMLWFWLSKELLNYEFKVPTQNSVLKSQKFWKSRIKFQGLRFDFPEASVEFLYILICIFWGIDLIIYYYSKIMAKDKLLDTHLPLWHKPLSTYVNISFHGCELKQSIRQKLP